MKIHCISKSKYQYFCSLVHYRYLIQVLSFTVAVTDANLLTAVDC